MSTQRRLSQSTSTSRHVSSSGSGQTARNVEGEEEEDGPILPRQSADPTHYQSSLPPQLARLTFVRHSPRTQTETHASSHLPPHFRSEDRSLRPVGLNVDIRNPGQNSDRSGESLILPPLNIGSTSRLVNTPARDDTRQSSHSRYVAERSNETNVRDFSPLEEHRTFSTSQPQSSRSPYYAQVAEGPDPVSGQRSTSGRQILSHGPLAANERHNSPRPRSALDSAYLSDLSSTSVTSSAPGGPPASTIPVTPSGWKASEEYSSITHNSRFRDEFSSRRQSTRPNFRRSPVQSEGQEADIDIPSGHRSLRVTMPVSTMRGGSGPAIAPGLGPSSRGRGYSRPRGSSLERDHDAYTNYLLEHEAGRQRRSQYDLRPVDYERRERRGTSGAYRGSATQGSRRAGSDEVYDFEYDEPPQASGSEADVEYEFEHRLHMQDTRPPVARSAAQSSRHSSSVFHESDSTRRADVEYHHPPPGRQSERNTDIETTPATVFAGRRVFQDDLEYAPRRPTNVQHHADETPTYERTSHRFEDFGTLRQPHEAYGRSTSSDTSPRGRSYSSTSRHSAQFAAPVPRPPPALPLLTGEFPSRDSTSAPPLAPPPRSTSEAQARSMPLEEQRQQYNTSKSLPPLRDTISDPSSTASHHQRSVERPFVRQVPVPDHRERYRVEPLNQAQIHRWELESSQSHGQGSQSPSLTVPASYTSGQLFERHGLSPPHSLHRVHSHDSGSRDLGIHRSAFVRDVRSASPMSSSGVVHDIQVTESTRNVLPSTSELLAGVPAVARSSVPIGVPVPLPVSVGVGGSQLPSGRTEVHLHIIHEDQYQVVGHPGHSPHGRSQMPPIFRSAPQTPTLISGYSPEPSSYRENHTPPLPPIPVPSQTRTDSRPLKRPKVAREIKEENSPTLTKASRRASSERLGRGRAGHRSSSDRLREGTSSIVGGSNAPSPATTQGSPFDSGAGGERKQRDQKHSEHTSPGQRPTSTGQSDQRRPTRPSERPIVRLGATPPPPPVPPRDDSSRVPRKKIDVACEFCRKRKMRCDGVRPACGNCKRKNVACEYTPEIRRRGPGKKKKESTPRPKRTTKSTRSRTTGGSGGEQEATPGAGPGPSTQAYLAQRHPSSGPSSSSPIPPGMLGMPPASSSSSPWLPVHSGLPPFQGQGGIDYATPPGQVPFGIGAQEATQRRRSQRTHQDEDQIMGDDTNEGDDRIYEEDDDDDDDEDYDEDEEFDEENRIKRAPTDDEDERGPPGAGGRVALSSTSVKMEE